jgi:flavin reductase (DIM6/NTAB) family NADH-FMN oxidoreductase RutF
MGIYNPRQTIIVTSRDNGFDNAITLSWHSPVSFSPFLYGIFLAKKRKSYEMIKNSKSFCVNFITENMEELAKFCGTNSGHKMNKFDEGGIAKEECSSINCGRIADCSAYLECKVKDMIEVGDHIMIVGEVVNEIEDTMEKKLFQSNIDGRLAFTTTID